MKNGKKPSYTQRKLIEKWKLDAHVWLVVKDTPDEMHIVHRYSENTMRIIPKRGGVNETE